VEGQERGQQPGRAQIDHACAQIQDHVRDDEAEPVAEQPRAGAIDDGWNRQGRASGHRSLGGRLAPGDGQPERDGRARHDQHAQTGERPRARGHADPGGQTERGQRQIREANAPVESSVETIRW